MLLLLPRFREIAQFFGVENAEVFGFGGMVFVSMLVVLFLDLAINVSFNPTRSLIADVTPNGDARTKGYTFTQFVSGFFGMMVNVIGIYLGNIWLIYIGAVLILVFSIIPPLFIKEPRELEEEEALKPGETSSVDRTKNNPRNIAVSFIANAFSWLGAQTMFVFSIFFAKEFLADIQTVGMSDDELSSAAGQTLHVAYLVMNAVAFLLPLFFLQPISKVIGRVKTHSIALLLMAIAYFIIAFGVRDALPYYCLFFFVGAGWSSIITLPFAIFSDGINQKSMGFWMGIFNLSIVIPQLIVGAAFGGFIDSSPKNMVFIICGVSVLASSVCWLFVQEKKPEPLFKK